MSRSLTLLIPGRIRKTISEQGLPDAAYAVAGAVDLALAEFTQLPKTLYKAPATAQSSSQDFVLNQAAEATTEGRRFVASLNTHVTDVYIRLVERGEHKVVHMATERAVRQRVGTVEDRVAPKMAQAAVRLQQRKRRWQETRRTNNAMVAVRRTRRAARRSAERFAEMNAPVLEDQSQ